MKVLLFGGLVDAVGKTTLDVDATDVESLKEILLHNFPSLKKQVFQVAVNYELVRENSTLKESDEIALLPPYAGG